MSPRLLGLVAAIPVIFLVSFQALAAGKSDSPTITLTPTVGGYLFSGGESLKPSPLYGIKLGVDLIGRNIADSLGVETTVNYFSTKSSAGAGKADGFILRLDSLYLFTPGKTWVPFAAVGVGGIDVNGPTALGTLNGQKDLLLNYGLGVKYFIENFLAFRVDARHLVIYHNVNTRNNFELSAGLTYLFGKERKKKAAKPVAPVGPAIPQLKDLEPEPGGPAGPSPSAPGAPGAAPAPNAADPNAPAPAQQKALPAAVSPQSPAAPPPQTPNQPAATPSPAPTSLPAAPTR